MTTIPHPNTYLNVGNQPRLSLIMGPAYQGLRNSIQDDKFRSYISTIDTISRGIEKNFSVALDDGSQMEPLTLRYATREYLLSKLFKDNHGAIIESTASLDEMMGNTDITDIPCSLVNPPYNHTYFHFKEPMRFDVFEYEIHGAYVFSKQYEMKDNPENVDHFKSITNDSIEGCQFFRRYELAFCIASKESQFLPRTLMNMNLTFADNSTRGILEEIAFQVSDIDHKGQLEGHEEAIVKAAERIIKTMLYMGLKEARIKPVNELSEFNKKLAGLGTKKLAKLSGKADQKYDRIVVGPESYASQLESEGSGNKATHWRRGHFRNQKHGEGLKESHIIWIQPVIVNASLDELPEPKKYKIKM